MQNQDYLLKLKELIKKYSLLVADEPKFKLVSGKLSKYYIDLKQVTFDPEGIYILGNVLYDMLKPFNVDAAGGLTLGADPMAYAVSIISFEKGRPIKPFVVRKEPKDHGMGKQIEGKLENVKNVAILEDVSTTGGSSLKAANVCKNASLNVVGIFTIVDREEGAKENIEKEGFKFYSVFKLSELL
jgi:orotate phosphoribosyltransferase